jgi:glycosyltransferase involved in cell wall biosynthesis
MNSITGIECSLIVPAFNEEETIGELLKNVSNVLSRSGITYEIIVVNDGSTDKTSSIACSVPGVKVITHPYNKGNGASVKAGIQESHGEKIVILDADGQHQAEHIPEMLNLLGEYDLVVGARDDFGFGRRGMGNFFVSKLATYLSGIEIPDLTSGYRAFKKEKMLEFIYLLPNGFSLPSTSTLAFAVNGYNIKFIPIKINKRQGGVSTIKVGRDGTKFIILIVRMISLFHPLKIFAPTSMILFFMGLLWSFRVFLIDYSISSIGAMLLMAGIVTFLIGLLADQISETRFSIGKIVKFHMKKDKENTN